MKKPRLVIVSLFVSLAVWILFTWPLPRYASKGIPMSHTGGRERPVRFMEPGDHLQLLYYHWLLSDMLQGHTAWMYNPYEFHTGDEEARRIPDSYYVPYSLVYSFFALWTTRAFAFNMAGFFSIWVTYFFSWLFVRRYARNEWVAASMAAIAILLPYRWVALLGGSPTGFGMSMTAILLWGLDRAVRDGSVRGGLWAGLAIIFSITSDLHTYFFNVLLTPVWCLLSFITDPRFEWRKQAVFKRVMAVLPAFLGVISTVVYSRIISRQLGETRMGEGRSIQEVMLFSPNREGFFGWAEHPVASQVYIGYALVILLFLGAAAIVWRCLKERPRPWRDTILYGCLLLGFGSIALLSLGPNAPRGASLYMLVREWIPKYSMIRQPGKIFSILPPLLALTAVLAVNHLTCKTRRRSVIALCCVLPLLLMGAEYARRAHPPISLLADEQPAYAAVADDAATRGVTPHVLVVTLWPGDSHFASVYQYHCSLYRIRMINGYSPAVGRDYFDNIFMRFQNINQGWLPDEQADDLLSRGIGYIIVYEDLFPEKVSPFPIAFTLKSLLAHERMELLKQDGPVWAFRILDEPSPRDAPAADDVFFPARHWIFERQPTDRGEVRQDITASRGQYLALTEPGAYVQAATTYSPPAPELRWMFRARGNGTLTARTLADDEIIHTQTVRITTDAWHWFEVPAPSDTYALLALNLELEEGSVDLCSTLLTAGRAIVPTAEQPDTLPAALFFHAGFLDHRTGYVHLRKGFDRPGAVFYGPKLPMDSGTYEVEIQYASGAAPGTVLGHIQIEQLFAILESPVQPVIAGKPATLNFTITENLPVNIILNSNARADITLKSISLRALR